MQLQYDANKLEQMLRDFHNLTGICVCILDRDFQKLVSFPGTTNPFCMLIQSSTEGKRRCFASDHTLLRACAERRETVIHRCHAGLTDMVVPILHADALLGYILFGQLRQTDGKNASFEDIYQNIGDLGLNVAMLKDTYRGLIFSDPEKIRSAAGLVEMLTKHVWLEQLIRPVSNERFEEIAAYIDGHLTSDLTVPSICRQFHVSKNTLYDYFKACAGCTVKEFVSDRRMLQAEQLLISTDLPIYEICERIGVENPHSFFRAFKKRSGMSPLQYRKKRLNQCQANQP